MVSPHFVGRACVNRGPVSDEWREGLRPSPTGICTDSDATQSGLCVKSERRGTLPRARGGFRGHHGHRSYRCLEMVSPQSVGGVTSECRGGSRTARPEIRGHHSPIVRTEMSMVSPHFRALDVNMAMILNGAKGNPNVGARCRVPAGGMGVVGICRGGTCPSRSKELDQFHEERRGSQVRTQRICRGSASDNGRDMSLPYRYSPELPVTPAPRRQSERAAKRPRGDGN